MGNRSRILALALALLALVANGASLAVALAVGCSDGSERGSRTALRVLVYPIHLRPSPPLCRSWIRPRPQRPLRGARQWRPLTW